MFRGIGWILMNLVISLGCWITFLKILLWFVDSYGQDAWEPNHTDAEEEYNTMEGIRANSADMPTSEKPFWT